MYAHKTVIKNDLKKIFLGLFCGLLWRLLLVLDFPKFARSCNEVLVTMAHSNGSCWNWCKSILWAI